MVHFDFHITGANCSTLSLKEQKQSFLGLDIQNVVLYFMMEIEEPTLRNGLLLYEWSNPEALYF